jgi:hypothetical protein
MRCYKGKSLGSNKKSPNWRGEGLGWLLDMAPNARRFSGWFLIHITKVLEVKELDPIHNCCSAHQKKKRKLTLI